MERYGGIHAADNLLKYECGVSDTESISWIQLRAKRMSFIAPLLFSSSHQAPPAAYCYAQINTQKAPTQTVGNIEYVCLAIDPTHSSQGMHAKISAFQTSPDEIVHMPEMQSAHACSPSREIPINCTNMALPFANCFAASATDTDKNITLSLQNIESEVMRKAGYDKTTLIAKYKMRMNHSLITKTIANTTLSVITAGEKRWQDTTSAAYLASVAATAVTNAISGPNFAVSTSNRIWEQNGGDPNILVCCLNQECVESINTMLPLLQMCKATDGYEKFEAELVKLVRLSIGGSVLGIDGKLSLLQGTSAVLSPVVFLRKPNRAQISPKGELECECDMFLVDTETETAMMQNPSMFGAGLLAVFSTADSLHLHNVDRSVDLSRCSLPACNPLYQMDDKQDSRELPIAGIGEWHGRLSTRYKVHSMYDFVCAIDRSNSKLMTYQTKGNTYQTQLPITSSAELLIRKSLSELSKNYDTFRSFVNLIGKSKLDVGIKSTHATIANILELVPTINSQLSDAVPEMLPDSAIGRQIYDKLTDSKDVFLQTCAPYVPKTPDSALVSSGAHLAPIRHIERLGRVQRICLIASGSCNSATNNRAVLLVQTQSPPDVIALFVDRHLGTDPEYFSSDLRMDSQSLAKASSVRIALGISADAELHIHSITRISSDATNLFTNKNGNLVHGKRHPMFAVQWKTDALSDKWNRTVFSIFTSNRVRTDSTTLRPIGRIITSKSADNGLYAKFNPNWGIKVITNHIL